jgi:hypothetical protein
MNNCCIERFFYGLGLSGWPPVQAHWMLRLLARLVRCIFLRWEQGGGCNDFVFGAKSETLPFSTVA